MTRQEAKVRGKQKNDPTFFYWFRDIEEDKLRDGSQAHLDLHLSHLKTTFQEAFNGLYKATIAASPEHSSSSKS
jgi:hypothetical protein